MKAWTDYPILDLGDKSGQEAPIRRVEILSYDRDKYCRIEVEGIIDLVKRGYLYRNPGRLGRPRQSARGRSINCPPRNMEHPTMETISILLGLGAGCIAWAHGYYTGKNKLCAAPHVPAPETGADWRPDWARSGTPTWLRTSDFRLVLRGAELIMQERLVLRQWGENTAREQKWIDVPTIVQPSPDSATGDKRGS